MHLSFQNSSTLPFDTIRAAIGSEACAWLETQKDRILFIVIGADTTQIYQNQNIKNFFEFETTPCHLNSNSENVNNLTDPHDNTLEQKDVLLCHLTNAEHKITPLIVVSSLSSKPHNSTSSNWSDIKLIVSPKSHGELLLIEGTSESAQYKHHILIEENARLASAWLFVQGNKTSALEPSIPQPPQDVQLNRLVEIKKHGIFYDEQIFAPQSNIQVHSKIKLTHEYAQSFSSGCVFADYGQLHYEPVQEHFAMHGKSTLKFNVVLAKRAKSFFRGLVILHKDAQKSEAYQENKNLLLSRTARADSEPRLEIVPNDVMCKHGSATAELDNKQLYYLMSRGFDNHLAKNMIVKSFCSSAFIQQEKAPSFLQTLVPFAIDQVFNSHSEIMDL